MERKYRRTFHIDAPNKIGTPEFGRLAARARSLMLEVIAAGDLSSSYSVDASNGAKLTSPDWQSLVTELRSDPELVPSSLWASESSDLFRTRPEEYRSIRIVAWLDRKPRRVQVTIETPRETEADGWEASIRRAISLAVPDTTAQMPSQSPQYAAAAPVNQELQTQAEGPAEKATSNEAGWLARTWKDHATTLVITIIGTVAAALLLIILGFSG